VEGVSYYDAFEFCVRLYLQEAKHYRLPTEAEWEYACRAGSTSKWGFGDLESELGNYAWYNSNSDQTTHPVGRKKPNAWGFHDMHGNVWEWCSDWYDSDYYYKASSVDDPTGPASGALRVIRGGGWISLPRFCRVADRGGLSPSDRADYVGFRVVRTP
jgi:formylglycine-generating enzyme required for sulfatase activity